MFRALCSRENTSSLVGNGEMRETQLGGGAATARRAG
jgi:hypothetical protein